MKQKHSIRDFRLASPDEISEFRNGHGILRGSPRGISAYVVYSFLKDHFGRPSHVEPDGDRITWEYVLKGPRTYLAVYDWKLHSWGIGIRLPAHAYEQKVEIEEIQKHDNEARADANILLDEIVKHARTVEIPLTKHSYQLIENTYKTSYSYGEEFLKSLSQPNDVSIVPELAQSFNHLVDFEDCCTAWAAIMAFLVSVEAMFNILFEVYLKREIREDKELCQRMFRLPLLDKWLLASSLCTCFETRLNRQSKGYQSLRKLIGIRNSWAHASIGDEMRIYLLRKDRLMFSTKHAPIWRERDRALSYPRISSVDLVSAINVKKDVDVIKSEMLNAMTAKDKKKFTKALEESYILLSKKGIVIF